MYTINQKNALKTISILGLVAASYTSPVMANEHELYASNRPI